MGRGGWLAAAVAVLALGVAAWASWGAADARDEARMWRLRAQELERGAEARQRELEASGQATQLEALRAEVVAIEEFMDEVPQRLDPVGARLDLHEVVRWSADANGVSEPATDWTARYVRLAPRRRRGRDPEVEVVALREGHPFEVLGFRKGDLLRNVNGVPFLAGLRGNEEVVPFWNTVRSDPDFRVEIVRNTWVRDIEFTRQEASEAFAELERRLAVREAAE